MIELLLALHKLYVAYYRFENKTDEQFEAMEFAVKTLGKHAAEWEKIKKNDKV